MCIYVNNGTKFKDSLICQIITFGKKIFYYLLIFLQNYSFSTSHWSHVLFWESQITSLMTPDWFRLLKCYVYLPGTCDSPFLRRKAIFLTCFKNDNWFLVQQSSNAFRMFDNFSSHGVLAAFPFLRILKSGSQNLFTRQFTNTGKKLLMFRLFHNPLH